MADGWEYFQVCVFFSSPLLVFGFCFWKTIVFLCYRPFVGWNDMSCHCGGLRPPWYDMAWRDVVWLVRLAVIIALGTQVVN